MISRILTVALLSAAACAHAPQPTEPQMREYRVVFLRRGPNWTVDRTPEVEAVSRGHMAHIQKMQKEGKLVLAGPFDVPPEDRAALAGLFVLDADIATAKALADADPAVQAGRFTYEILTWYGPAGITFSGTK